MDKLCQLTLHRAQTVDQLQPENGGNENELQEMLDADFSGRVAAIARHEKRCGRLPSINSSSRYEAGLGRWLRYQQKQRRQEEKLREVNLGEEQIQLLNDVGEPKSAMETVRLV